VKLRRLVTGMAILVAAVVSLTVVIVPIGPAAFPHSHGVAPKPLTEFYNASFQGCCFAAGIAHAAIAPLRPAPNGTSSVYLSGSFGVEAWMKLNNSLIIETGNCANSFSPRGACDLFVGVWTPTSWLSFVAGGPLDPLWCFPGNGTNCQNVSGGYVYTPNLSHFDGQGLEVVLWNLDTYRLDGSYSFQMLTSESD